MPQDDAHCYVWFLRKEMHLKIRFVTNPASLYEQCFVG